VKAPRTPAGTSPIRSAAPSARAGGVLPAVARRLPTWWPPASLGAASAAAYVVLLLWPMRIWSRSVSPDTNLVQTFGVDRAGALRYVLTVAVLFGLYGASLWLVLGRGLRPPLGLVLGVAAACCGALVFTHPLSSNDIFNYIVSARIQWLYGDNPLTTPPLAHPEDPFFRLLFFWREVPSPYGPLWSLLAAVPHALGDGHPAATVVAFKATAAAFLLITGLLVALTAERLRRGWGAAAALVLVWNPLAVWHVAGNGHNDAVMACLLALAVYLLARGLPGPALLALTASALVKFATLLLLPAIAVWWWRSSPRPSVRTLAPWLAGAVALSVLAYAPYWAGGETFRTSLDEGSYFAVSTPAAVRGALARLLDMPLAETLAAWGGRLAFLGVYAALLARLRDRRPEVLVATGALALMAYLALAATYFAPWYVLWPLTLAGAVPWRREALAPALTLALGSMSVLLWATWARARLASDPLGDWYPMHLLTAVCVAVPAAAAWWWARRGGRARAAGSADVHAPVGERQIARARPEG
jgi:hypothetical protein